MSLQRRAELSRGKGFQRKPRSLPSGVPLRSPFLPCGPGWLTKEAAENSPHGQEDGAAVFRCFNRSCPKWHVRSAPVPVAAVPVQKPRRETGFPHSVKLATRKRAGLGDIDNAHCEACPAERPTWLGRYGGDIQHRLARGAGGCRSTVVNGLSNAALLCRPCHLLAERRDEGMRLRGFWIRSGNGPEHDPRFVPVTLTSAGGSRTVAWLSGDGTYAAQAPEEVAAA